MESQSIRGPHFGGAKGQLSEAQRITSIYDLTVTVGSYKFIFSLYIYMIYSFMFFSIAYYRLLGSYRRKHLPKLFKKPVLLLALVLRLTPGHLLDQTCSRNRWGSNNSNKNTKQYIYININDIYIHINNILYICSTTTHSCFCNFMFTTNSMCSSSLSFCFLELVSQTHPPNSQHFCPLAKAVFLGDSAVAARWEVNYRCVDVPLDGHALAAVHPRIQAPRAGQIFEKWLGLCWI